MVLIYNKYYPEYTYDEIKNNHFGYIYVTINNIDNKKYIGLSYANKNDSKYLGSGHYLKNAIKYYGKENFSKYVIDYADSLDELENLEVEYITKRFGINVTMADDWYNINDGKQRGGDTWAGMTDEDRAKRLEKFRNTKKTNNYTISDETRKLMSYNAHARFKDPNERLKTSQATRKAMRSIEVRQKMLGKKHKAPDPKYKDKLSKTQHDTGVKNVMYLTEYYKSNDVWNKGKKSSKDIVLHQSEYCRKRYMITVHYSDDREDFNNIVSATNLKDLSLFIKESRIANLGKNKVRQLVKSMKLEKISEYLSIKVECIAGKSMSDKLEIILPAKYYDKNLNKVEMLNTRTFIVKVTIKSKTGKPISRVFYWRTINELISDLELLTHDKLSRDRFTKLNINKHIGKYKIIEWERYKV